VDNSDYNDSQVLGYHKYALPKYFFPHPVIELREIGWGGMDWIDLAQDRDQWRALVNMLMNLLIP
jgi:hypothetical protein